MQRRVFVYAPELSDAVLYISKKGMKDAGTQAIVLPRLRRFLREKYNEYTKLDEEAVPTFIPYRRDYGYGAGRTLPKDEPLLCEAIAYVVSKMGEFDFVVSHPLVPFVEWHMGLDKTEVYPLKEIPCDNRFANTDEDCVGHTEKYQQDVNMVDGKHRATFHPYGEPAYTKTDYTFLDVEFFQEAKRLIRLYRLYRLSPQQIDDFLVESVNAPKGLVLRALTKARSNWDINYVFEGEQQRKLVQESWELLPRNSLWWEYDNVLFTACDIYELLERKVDDVVEAFLQQVEEPTTLEAA